MHSTLWSRQKSAMVYRFIAHMANFGKLNVTIAIDVGNGHSNYAVSTKWTKGSEQWANNWHLYWKGFINLFERWVFQTRKARTRTEKNGINLFSVYDTYEWIRKYSPPGMWSISSQLATHFHIPIEYAHSVFSLSLFWTEWEHREKSIG